MNTIHTGHKAKAVICFCLIFMVSGLTAQNKDRGTYKVIKKVEYPYYTSIGDALEINNHYYVLSEMHDHHINAHVDGNHVIMVTVFDEELNMIKEFELSDKMGYNIQLAMLLYKDNIFYVFGEAVVREGCANPCFAKFDENFNLLQPISLYAMNDNYDYGLMSNIFMTEKNEFVFMTYFGFSPSTYEYNRLFHIDNNGELLLDTLVPYWGGWGNFTATDNHYLLNTSHSYEVIKICKDSLGKMELVNVESVYDFCGTATTVGNQLIRINEFRMLNGCPNVNIDYPFKYQTQYDIGILVLNEDFSGSRYFTIGNHNCIDDFNADAIDYINPDSIYLIYETKIGNRFTVSIANFSYKGKINFDYTLNLLTDDTLTGRRIWGCKALSNGGVLVYGEETEYSDTGTMYYAGILVQGSVKAKNGFLLLYHPPKKQGNDVQEVALQERVVYPNPAQSQFTVTNTENAEIQLFNILGQKVFQTFGKQENTVVNTVSLPQGLYVLKVVKGDFSTVHKVQLVR